MGDKVKVQNTMTLAGLSPNFAETEARVGQGTWNCQGGRGGGGRKNLVAETPPRNTAYSGCGDPQIFHNCCCSFCFGFVWSAFTANFT